MLRHQNLLARIYVNKSQEHKKPIEKRMVNTYNLIDDIIFFIESQNDKLKKLYVHSLVSEPIMKVPVEHCQNLKSLESLPDGYYDEIVDDAPVYYCKLLDDVFRSEIIEKLYQETNNVELVRWQLKRLEKYYKLGLEGYEKAYQM